jgi:hypothetical protein
MDLKAHSYCDPFPTDWTTNHVMHDENFRYRPLDLEKDSIRLIKVLPDLSDDGLIICEISHTTIKSKYQCLSYRWGSQKSPKTILIQDIPNTDSTKKRFQVGRNLYSFLNAARGLQDGAGPYWIDAMCIDQQNVSERNHQVRQMGKIYSQTQGVVVWLGNYPQKFEKLTTHGDKALYEVIIHNEYWQRAWIIQELVLPRRVEVLVYRTCISFQTLLHKLAKQKRNDPLSLGSIGDVLHLAWLRDRHHQRQRQRWKGLPSLDTTTIDRAIVARCSISRDRIYSLLALVRRGNKLTVDYAMPALELIYGVLKLSPTAWGIDDVLFVLSLLRNELGDSTDSLVTDIPYVDYNVFFIDSHISPYPEDLYATFTNWFTRKLLIPKDIGSSILVLGDGYRIIRKTSQSLLLNIRVALSTLAKWDAGLVVEKSDYMQHVTDLRVDTEFEAWARANVPFYGLTSYIPSSRRKARNAFNKVTLGYGRLH